MVASIRRVDRDDRAEVRSSRRPIPCWRRLALLQHPVREFVRDCRACGSRIQAEAACGANGSPSIFGDPRAPSAAAPVFSASTRSPTSGLCRDRRWGARAAPVPRRRSQCSRPRGGPTPRTSSLPLTASSIGWALKAACPFASAAGEHPIPTPTADLRPSSCRRRRGSGPLALPPLRNRPGGAAIVHVDHASTVTLGTPPSCGRRVRERSRSAPHRPYREAAVSARSCRCPTDRTPWRFPACPRACRSSR
jgi:hypothetical protein